MDTNRLYDLLPVIHRMRDAERGYPLRDFMSVLSEQAQVLENDIARLYDNWFIETCDDWVVPYIGDLIGYQLLPEAATLGEDGRPALRLGRVLAPRADVANTIDARRRKGTLSLLEDLAHDSAGWPARAVEFYRLLARMQHLDHLRPGKGGTVNVRDPGPLELVGGAFDPFAHTVDVRRITSTRGRGRYNIPSVGLFVFRLRTYSVTKTPAYCLEERGPNAFSFSVLGNDTQLFQRPVEETVATHIAEERNLPVPLRRFRFAERGAQAKYEQASSECYGEDKSVLVWAPDWPKKGEGLPIPREALIPADLSGWKYRVPRGRVAVDPKLGRILFPAEQRPRNGAWVSYIYGFAADLGGGEYPRSVVELEGAIRYFVQPQPPSPESTPLADKHFLSLSDALAAWLKYKDDTQAAGATRPRALIVEFTASGVYEGRLDITLEAGEAIQLQAAQGTRPVLRLVDYRADRPDSISIAGRRASRIIFDGLMIAGRGIDIEGPETEDGEAAADDDLCEVVIRHSTLVPGWGLGCDCDPKRPGEPSLTIEGSRARVRIDHSIVGAISVVSPGAKPSLLTICDSIVDATSQERVAIGSPEELVACVRATFERSTFIGEVQVHTMDGASDCIFKSALRVLRRQIGCVRFCYVPTGSRTPRRFHCQPDLEASAAEIARVVPQFMSLRYGNPNYARLADDTCIEIASGASDKSAMGVYHDLFEPQRYANLAARLDEYAPAGIDAGILFAT